MVYVVTAPVVAVSVPVGARTSQIKFLDQGASVPEGVTEAQIAHLLSMGMIADPEPQPQAKPAGKR